MQRVVENVDKNVETNHDEAVSWLAPLWYTSVQPTHHLEISKPGVLILRHLEVGNTNSITVLDDGLTKVGGVGTPPPNNPVGQHIDLLAIRPVLAESKD